MFKQATFTLGILATLTGCVAPVFNITDGQTGSAFGIPGMATAPRATRSQPAKRRVGSAPEAPTPAAKPAAGPVGPATGRPPAETPGAQPAAGSANPATGRPPAETPGAKPALVFSTAWVGPAIEAPGVSYDTFASPAARSDVSYHVFLPPTYADQPTKRFPVLYWLHGTGGGEGGIAGLTKIFGDAMRAGKVAPMIVVFPNGLPYGQWADSKDGNTRVESMLIEDFIPHVDRTYRTEAAPTGRIIEGFSMGGYGAGRVGFKHSHLFAGISMLAGGPLDLAFEGARASSDPESRALVLDNVHGGDLAYFQAVSPRVMAEAHQAQLTSRVRIRVAVGELDFTLEKNRDFHDHLDALGIPHDFSVVPGVKHSTPNLLGGLGEANWAFYAEALGGGRVGSDPVLK